MKWVKKIYSFFVEERKREQTIILDVCALKTQKSMEIIENASKVVLLLGTIRELDDNKKTIDLQGKNIRTILKASREDFKSKKYLCVSGYERYSYVDDNIIEYCKQHKNTTILTCDNGLCNKAKAFHIPYIFSEDEQINTEPISSATSVAQNQEKQQCFSSSETELQSNSQNETKTEVQNELKIETQVELNYQPQDEVKKDYIRLCKEISLGSKGLYIKPIKGCYVNYAVVRESETINAKECHVGDDIYIFRKYNKSELMKIIIYNVVEDEEDVKAEKIKEYDIWCMNDIYRLHLIEELEKKAREFYM